MIDTEPPSIPPLELTDRLKLARRKAGLQQQDIADAVGKHRRTIANYETGATTPELGTLEAWATVCNVPRDWLVEGPDHRCDACKAMDDGR